MYVFSKRRVSMGILGASHWSVLLVVGLGKICVMTLTMVGLLPREFMISAFNATCVQIRFFSNNYMFTMYMTIAVGM